MKACLCRIHIDIMTRQWVFFGNGLVKLLHKASRSHACTKSHIEAFTSLNKWTAKSLNKLDLKNC